MSRPPVPNRIHQLPVRVSYYIPHSDQSYSIIFPTLLNVYIHPSANDAGDEVWGSTYLKMVVKGVLGASPELHPDYPSASDLSLYVLDPRETFFRQTRGQGSTDRSSNSEVWTGKGLVSWALAEAGIGKNLIVGRLQEDVAFANIGKVSHLSALEQLMEADRAGSVGEAGWGIDISMGLNLGSGGPPAAFRRSQSSSRLVRRSSSVAAEEYQTQRSRPNVSRHLYDQAGSSSGLKPEAMSRAGSSTSRTGHVSRQLFSSEPASLPRNAPICTPDLGVSSPALTPCPHPVSSTLVREPSQRPTPLITRPGAMVPRSVPPKKRAPPRKPPAPSSDNPILHDAFSSLGENCLGEPDNLTREEAQRLLANPEFLSILGRITGTSYTGPSDPQLGDKRKRADEDANAQPKKKRGRPTKAEKAERDARAAAQALAAKVKELAEAPDREDAACWNCKRTQSLIWRTRVLDDGTRIRVCNACGLYWNKAGTMRPANLWVADDDEESRAAGKLPASATGHLNQPTVRSINRSQESFKRTLSAAVNQDAERLARHKGRQVSTSKLGPMTSPPRGSASASNSFRQSAAASSPGKNLGVFDESFEAEESNASPKDAPVLPKSVPHPQPLRHNAPVDSTIQTLNLPLSDDGPHGQNSGQVEEWNDQMSAFFDVEGFSMAPMTDGLLDHRQSISIHGPHRSIPIHATSSSMIDNHMPTDSSLEEDTVLSELFNRTSSMAESSPIAFDFSQLPPSSPPLSVLSSDALPHSALLLSSPMKKYSPSVSGQTPSASGLTPVDANRLLQSNSKLRNEVEDDNGMGLYDEIMKSMGGMAGGVDKEGETSSVSAQLHETSGEDIFAAFGV
ncbi:hypothetical protein B9479_001613 [Cryptococcus floricola]|uniref:GATA-type domain-containing protein n=1 Tax=Cryptococcus floricola TaxID=2591691 RepID=A0A5D3B549_9TREE|nr:hypothetical protein B9479_001613 [Cryptococcus floricola]